MTDRSLKDFVQQLCDATVLGELTQPLKEVLDRGGRRLAQFTTLTHEDFMRLGVWRHLGEVESLRDMVQRVWHKAGMPDQLPLARATMSDALNSQERERYVRNSAQALARCASLHLPDRLADIPGLGDRPVYLLDATYQKPRSHHRLHHPERTKNAKGHAVMPIYDLRRAIPVDLMVEDESHHELEILKRYHKDKGAYSRASNAVWVVDLAYLSKDYWNRLKRTTGSTMITRWRDDLKPEELTRRDIKKILCNDGVTLDLRVKYGNQVWRKIAFVSEGMRPITLLTNDLQLEPGIVAFLYLRRWDQEKSFDQWKNDWEMRKAWCTSLTGVTNQAYLVQITHILLALYLHNNGADVDVKSLKKQDQRVREREEKRYKENRFTDRPSWSVPLYRCTSKISRQVLRFVRDHLLEKVAVARPREYLPRLLEAYL